MLLLRACERCCGLLVSGAVAGQRWFRLALAGGDLVTSVYHPAVSSCLNPDLLRSGRFYSDNVEVKQKTFLRYTDLFFPFLAIKI